MKIILIIKIGICAFCFLLAQQLSGQKTQTDSVKKKTNLSNLNIQNGNIRYEDAHPIIIRSSKTNQPKKNYESNNSDSTNMRSLNGNYNKDLQSENNEKIIPNKKLRETNNESQEEKNVLPKENLNKSKPSKYSTRKGRFNVVE